jgi:hypothetical protein
MLQGNPDKYDIDTALLNYSPNILDYGEAFELW